MRQCLLAPHDRVRGRSTPRPWPCLRLRLGGRVRRPCRPRAARGSTENATVATALLSDLVDRGLRLSEEQLYVRRGRRHCVRRCETSPVAGAGSAWPDSQGASRRSHRHTLWTRSSLATGCPKLEARVGSAEQHGIRGTGRDHAASVPWLACEARTLLLAGAYAETRRRSAPTRPVRQRAPKGCGGPITGVWTGVAAPGTITIEFPPGLVL